MVSDLTVITDEVRTVAGSVDDGAVLIDAATLEDAVGWQLRPDGLCRGDVCVLVPDREALVVDHRVDLAELGRLLERRSIVDPDHGVIALSLPAEHRRQAIVGLEAPSFTLPDLDGQPHSLEEWDGRRRMLFAFSNW